MICKKFFGLVAHSRRSRTLPSGMEPERMLGRYTVSALNVAEEARQMAGGQEVEPEHLLWGLLAAQTSLAAGAARSFGLTFESVTDVLQASEAGESGLRPSSPSESGRWSERSQMTFSFALRAALRNRCQMIGDDHLLLGVVAESADSESPLSKLLAELGADYRSVEQRIQRMRRRPCSAD